MFTSHGTSKSGADIGDTIAYSLMLDKTASQSLTRTPGGAGNLNTWVWSGWVKFCAITGYQYIFGASSDNYANSFTLLQMDNAASTLTFYDYQGADTFRLKTNQLFRDPAAWYHIVCAVDTTQATASDRVRIYINGSLVTSLATSTYPPQNQNTRMNAAIAHTNGYASASLGTDGYLANVIFIGGYPTGVTSGTWSATNIASLFGRTSADTGAWVNKTYSGSYSGTNSSLLNFSNSAALGTDSSGNGNNWTLNGGITSANQYTDTPTNNYAVLNAIYPNPSTFALSIGNLKHTTPVSNYGLCNGTIAIPTTGKWYWEMTANSLSAAYAVGIEQLRTPAAGSYVGEVATSYGYISTANKINNTTQVAYGATWTVNDVIGIAFNADTLDLTFYKNGSTQGSAYTVSAGTYFPAGSDTGGAAAAVTYNFGAKTFAYTPPTGYKALCTQNLPTPTIIKPNKYFDAVLWTGTASTRTISLNNSSLKTGLVWIKDRSNAQDHKLTDIVRGATKALISDTNGAETTDANGVTSFGTGSFNLGTGTRNYNDTNGDTYVGWAWATDGTSGSANTVTGTGAVAGVTSVDATCGVSISTFTSQSSGVGTVTHGLGVAPKFIILKPTGAVTNWFCWHTGLTSASYYINLNSTSAQTLNTNYWNATAPDSTKVTIGSALTSFAFVMYAFADVPGFSKFGATTANNSADGSFYYCGFRPRWILIKPTSLIAGWIIYDTARDTYNVSGNEVYPHLANIESAGNVDIDILSNGFKFRSSSLTINNSTNTGIFAAFAECPFNYANAR